mmetsp:Transcript_101350/g.285862  ORF Transcript_101350/g.285862 Transcript_101350/m.285862 type:complete len:1060 (-) Transcript_101350:152-3331(-)
MLRPEASADGDGCHMVDDCIVSDGDLPGLCSDAQAGGRDDSDSLEREIDCASASDRDVKQPWREARIDASACHVVDSALTSDGDLRRPCSDARVRDDSGDREREIDSAASSDHVLQHPWREARSDVGSCHMVGSTLLLDCEFKQLGRETRSDGGVFEGALPSDCGLHQPWRELGGDGDCTHVAEATLPSGCDPLQGGAEALSDGDSACVADGTILSHRALQRCPKGREGDSCESGSKFEIVDHAPSVGEASTARSSCAVVDGVLLPYQTSSPRSATAVSSALPPVVSGVPTAAHAFSAPRAAGVTRTLPPAVDRVPLPMHASSPQSAAGAETTSFSTAERKLLLRHASYPQKIGDAARAPLPAVDGVLLPMYASAKQKAGSVATTPSPAAEGKLLPKHASSPSKAAGAARAPQKVGGAAIAPPPAVEGVLLPMHMPSPSNAAGAARVSPLTVEGVLLPMDAPPQGRAAGIAKAPPPVVDGVLLPMRASRPSRAARVARPVPPTVEGVLLPMPASSSQTATGVPRTQPPVVEGILLPMHGSHPSSRTGDERFPPPSADGVLHEPSLWRGARGAGSSPPVVDGVLLPKREAASSSRVAGSDKTAQPVVIGWTSVMPDTQRPRPVWCDGGAGQELGAAQVKAHAASRVVQDVEGIPVDAGSKGLPGTVRDDADHVNLEYAEYEDVLTGPEKRLLDWCDWLISAFCMCCCQRRADDGQREYRWWEGMRHDVPERYQRWEGIRERNAVLSFVFGLVGNGRKHPTLGQRVHLIFLYLALYFFSYSAMRSLHDYEADCQMLWEEECLRHPAIDHNTSGLNTSAPRGLLNLLTASLDSECPWLSSTSSPDEMGCFSGGSCNVETHGWDCCGSGMRMRCPEGYRACNATVDDAGLDFVCQRSCAAYGGVRGCEGSCRQSPCDLPMCADQGPSCWDEPMAGPAVASFCRCKSYASFLLTELILFSLVFKVIYLPFRMLFFVALGKVSCCVQALVAFICALLFYMGGCFLYTAVTDGHLGVEMAFWVMTVFLLSLLEAVKSFVGGYLLGTYVLGPLCPKWVSRVWKFFFA